MSITNAQRESRRNHIGSSDVAALFIGPDGKSLDPFKGPLTVWTSKVYGVDPEENAAMRRGNRYEHALIEFAKEELGCAIETDPEKLHFVCKEHPLFEANLDGYTVESKPRVIEVKTSGMAQEWGDASDDDVPARVILQTHHQLLCSGMDTALVVVLLGKFGLQEKIYTVNRNEEIINYIIQRGEDFWNNHVLTKVPPPDAMPGDIELIKRIVREPETWAEIDEGLVRVWQDKNQSRLAAEKEEKIALAALLAAVGTAEGARTSFGTFTYLTQNGADNIDRDLMREKYPDIYKEVASSNKYRKAAFKKNK